MLFKYCLKLPIGPIVVPFWGSYLESYKVIPRRNYYGASGYILGAAPPPCSSTPALDKQRDFRR